MAETWFNAKEWKARLVEFAGRRMLRNVANGETTTYDVSRSEGQVSQEGDAFNTKNMNDLEQRVANGFASAKTAVDTLSRDLHALNDSGAIKGLDAREDGVYITYSPTGGADAVTKKLGSPTIKTKTVTGNGTFDAGGKVLFAGIQNAGLHIMTYAQKYGQGSHYSATCSYTGNMITYDQHAYGENTSGTDQYSMTIIYAVE